MAGLAHAAAMAAPWSGEPVAWLQLLAMVVLVGQLALAKSPRQAAWLGWVFCTAWLCGTFWWLYISMHTYGGLNPVVTVVAIVALAGALSGYYAAACYLFRRFADSSIPLSAMLFASLWTMAEMARGTWFTGFGWGAAAYAHLSGLGVFAKYVGAYGVGALAAFIACSVALWLLALRPRPRPLAGAAWVGPSWQSVREARSWRSLAPVLLIAGLAAVADREFSAPGPALNVVLLQGNIKQSEKFEPSTGIADALRWYREQAHLAASVAPTPPAAAGNGAIAASGKPGLPLLVVGPETAIPLLPQQLPADYWAQLVQPFTAAGVPVALLIGIPLGSYQAGYTNSVLGVSNEKAAIKPTETAPQPHRDAATTSALLPGAPYHYAKHHLVPFGEFIPPLFKWFTELMNIPLGDFNRGAVGQASFAFAGQRLAPNICYEDLFGEELAARFSDLATAPTMFVNVSNIGWFGNTLAIDQHRAISRMRAMEFERPFIRATNTGDTVVIDHTGRVLQALPRHTRGVLTAAVQGRQGDAQNPAGITPFATWAARSGLWPVWLICLFILIFSIYKNKNN